MPNQLEVTALNAKHAVQIKDADVDRKAHIRGARLTHNQQETNVRAVDVKLRDNNEGTCAQITSVGAKVKNSKTEISATQVDIRKDANNNKAIVTAANVTKDAEGNVKKVAITNAGAGKSYNIPIKGNKKIGGVTVRHEATGLIEEQGEQKIFHVFSISTYDPNMRAEKWEALKKLYKLFSKVPRQLGTRVCYKILLLIFYIFLFLYPLITFLVDRNYIVYNLICIGLGGFGFLLQLIDFHQLYKDVKEICSNYGCCKSEDSESGHTDDKSSKSSDSEDSDADTMCKCKELCKCCPGAVRKIASIFFNEVLLYAAVICTIMGFISEQTWELRNFWSYVDCVLLAYSIAMEVFVPRWFYLRWICSVINTLRNEYFNARKWKKYVCSCNGMCTRYVTPLQYTPVFVVMVIILQTSMLGSITVRVYADNFFADVNATINGTEYIEEVTIPEDGTYHVSIYTWYTIIGGIVVPFLSIATYFIINQYWLWQPLHYTGQHTSGFVPKNTMIGSMTDADKWMIFAFDPVAWVAMVLLLASFIAFCVFASLQDYNREYFPDWVNGIFIFSYIFMTVSFVGANIQTVAFGSFVYFQPCCLFIVLLQMFRRPRYRVH